VVTPYQLAAEHCGHLPALERRRYLAAFREARTDELAGRDTDNRWLTLLQLNAPSETLSGYVEGLASTRSGETPLPRCSHPQAGTYAAYQFHTRHGEKPCPACRAANADRSADYRAARRAQEVPDVA
jgi:hypothetical protein